MTSSVPSPSLWTAPAFHHERRGIIAAEAERIQQAARKGIVLLPVGVQAVDLAAPGVEAPVDAAHRAVGGPADKCRGNVARPGIVAIKVQQADVGPFRQSIRSAEERECGFTAT